MGLTQIWSEGDVTVWLFSLDVSDYELSALTESLSPFEIAQAESHSKPELRSRFLVRRGMLRRLLGQELACDPADLQFQVEQFGKPLVVGYPIHFSASSSKDFGVVACSKVHQLGVDIENHNEVLASKDFEFYTDSEIDALKNAKESPDLFFRIWTRKEACVKAIGQGVRFRLGDLDVLPDDSDTCAVQIPETVIIKDLPTPEGYSAAFALLVG